MKFYGYKKCSSCRDAEKALIKGNVDYEFIDITERPPSAAELKAAWTNSGLELKKFLNTSGEVYRELGLKDKIAGMSEESILKLLASNGRLIKRPLIIGGKKATVGAADVAKVWL